MENTQRGKGPTEEAPRHTYEQVIDGTRFTIFNRDCISEMPIRLGRRSLDVVVTSPPYNIGVKYGEYDDTAPREEYLDWIETWAATVKDLLHDQGSLFLNVGAKPSDPWVPFDVLQRMKNHFQLQNVIHWVKAISIAADQVGDSAGIPSDVSIGHYKPINSSRFVNDCHEYIFHFTRSGDVELDRLAIGVKYQDKSNVKRWKAAKADKRCRGNTWFVPYKTIQNRSSQRPHPATFPLEIPRMCIQLHGVHRTKQVMDPFMGLGNTALACLQLGIDFVGFEVDSEYHAVACNSLRGFHPDRSGKGPIDKGAQMTLF